ncbi:HAMP domain-containing sensor histidine kinase [Paramaledivibacter caminithermalis]|nr:HAMP domain-containing sensor histidine kinase [Paramaledivibacter caminithermalis]
MAIEVIGEMESYDNQNTYIFPYQIIIDGKEYDSFGIGGFESNEGQYNTIILEDILEDFQTTNVVTGSIDYDFILENSEDIELVKIKGYISSLYIPDEKFYSSLYKEQTLYNNILNLMENKNLSDIFKENELSFYELMDEGTGIKNIIFIKPVDIKNHGQYLFFASTSLQPVDDAIAIIKNYNKYFFLLAFIMVAIAAYFYSKIISRPLIHMKNIACKMANLDFSSECKIDSDDEIGDLANSLNTLSNNLNTSLTQLKEANEKLVDDIERERKQEKIRKEFIANISHELKTPLTIIEGIASGIRDSVYDSHDVYHINSLIEEVNHMNELIFEMLQLSKIEADGYSLNWEIFDISDIVLKVHSKFKKLVKDKNIEVILDLEEVFANGDSKKLEQVITNLYSNAVRYTNEGEKILINIKENEEKIFVFVENTGVNIPENEIEEIWKPFYRIEKSRNRESGGTGLGLQIVKRILEHHKSDFGVKNSNNSVIFYFSLDKHVDARII